MMRLGELKWENEREAFVATQRCLRRVPVTAEDVRQRADQRTVVVHDEDGERLSRRF